MKIVPETLWFLAYFRTVKSQATNYDALILALRATPKFNEKEKLLSMWVFIEKKMHFDYSSMYNLS